MAEWQALVRLGELLPGDPFTRDGIAYSVRKVVSTDTASAMEAFSPDLIKTRVFPMSEDVSVTPELRDLRHKCAFIGLPRMCAYSNCYKTPEPSWVEKLHKALAP